MSRGLGDVYKRQLLFSAYSRDVSKISFMGGVYRVCGWKVAILQWSEGI